MTTRDSQTDQLCLYVVATFQASPSPDYVLGPYPPLPDFVLEPVYPEFMPPEDEVYPAEEQPLPAATSPTADSPGYAPESDPEEDLEEDDDEDPEEDPADYPADGGDDNDDEDESSDDDEDEDVDIKGDEEEEEHPAPADSTIVALPAVDQGPIAEAASTSHSLLLPPPIILSHTRLDAPPSGTPPLLPILLPTSSPPLHLLSTDRRADRPEVTLPPRKSSDCRVQASTAEEQSSIYIMLAADHERHAQFIEALKLLKRLQTQMTEFERQQRDTPGPAKGPAQPDAPEEAGSSS
ncbi:hypothetical protein Tco_0988129 [Tanacetum coccineum]|uniref:Uncharacterized protein n=1 Tax=Tanacetum coccineum TaxID=301880 RepID=A0ABQ5EQA2_9ASTR